VILSRRRLHRRMFTALAFIVPAMLGAALIWRPTVPPVADIDPALRAPGGFPDPGEWRPRVVDTGKHTFQVQGRANPDGKGATLVIRPETVLLKPDLLVYWAPRDDVAQQITDDAILVGSLSGTSRRLLRLPEAAASGDGELLVYSLAHQEIVDRIALRDALAPLEFKE